MNAAQILQLILALANIVPGGLTALREYTELIERSRRENREPTDEELDAIMKRNQDKTDDLIDKLT